MSMKKNFLSNIINFFRKIFKIKDKPLLPESDLKQDSKVKEKITEKSFKDTISLANNDKNSSDKNITMFLYKQLRLGNLDPKYIPDEYLERIAKLLKEEKKIKKNELDEMHKQILENENIIKKYNEG